VLARAALALAVVGAAAPGATAGVEVGTLSPRAIGHAGASLVSDDGAAAALQCPAAMARRDGRRAQLAGIAFDDEAVLATSDHPRVTDTGGAAVMPLLGAQGGLGGFVVGASFAVTDQLDRALPVPGAAIPDDQVLANYPHRYAGLEAGWTRRTIAVGAALRATEWLAVGASLTLSQVDVHERRRLWAGFRGRDRLAEPNRDLDLALSGSDGLVPGAVLGVLIAPLDTPLELAAGVAWADDVRVEADVAIAALHAAPTVDAAQPRAHGRFGSPLVSSVGVRWLGARWSVEGAATLTRYPTRADAWAVSGVGIVDQSGARAELTAAPTRLPRRDRGTLSVALDVELLPGFAWLTGAYRWASSGQAGPQVATVGADPGGHTLAGGLALSAGAAVITIGVSHQLARTTVVGAPGLALDNPFPGGTAPANLGRHDVTLDVVGIGLELSGP